MQILMTKEEIKHLEECAGHKLQERHYEMMVKLWKQHIRKRRRRYSLFMLRQAVHSWKNYLLPKRKQNGKIKSGTSIIARAEQAQL